MSEQVARKIWREAPAIARAHAKTLLVSRPLILRVAASTPVQPRKSIGKNHAREKRRRQEHLKNNFHPLGQVNIKSFRLYVSA